MRSTKSVNKFKVADPTDTWNQKLQLELIARRNILKRETDIKTVQKLYPALSEQDPGQEQDAIYVLSEKSTSNFNKLPESNRKNDTA